MMQLRTLITSVCAFALAIELVGPDTCRAADPALQVRGSAGRTLSWGIDDLKRLPQQSAKIEDSPGVFAEYQGVALHDVLKSAGAPIGKGISGAALKHFVAVQAADGSNFYRPPYSAVLS